MDPSRHLSRRDFLASSALLALGTSLNAAERDSPPVDPIIDIHQHTNYSGRTNKQLIAHQKTMGVTRTVLLPAGSMFGLDVGAGGNQTVVDLAREHPQEFVYFANEVPYLAGARDEIEKYLKLGALGIGEQKFRVACDSRHIQTLAALAQEFRVPMLMHFQHGAYNVGIERMYKTLEKFPQVNFFGHAQTWWANIDRNCKQEILYPTGKVASGGISDRLLADYPNMFGDFSAGSGLNALQRDENHARAFMERHQDKLVFGSDCNDLFGQGPGCQGAQIIAAIKRLAPSKAVERKILYENAKRLLKL